MSTTTTMTGTLEPEVRRLQPSLSETHHSPLFDFDEAALPIGVQLLVRTAERYLAA
jgi:metal-dependent amidase/aminoacylase/carboxypeptidase family protein